MRVDTVIPKQFSAPGILKELRMAALLRWWIIFTGLFCLLFLGPRTHLEIKICVLFDEHQEFFLLSPSIVRVTPVHSQFLASSVLLIIFATQKLPPLLGDSLIVLNAALEVVKS